MMLVKRCATNAVFAGFFYYLIFSSFVIVLVLCQDTQYFYFINMFI